MTGSYNNFFHIFDRSDKQDICLEASPEFSKPRQILKPRRVAVTGKRKKDDIAVECLDFSHKILHTAWHPQENIIAVAATNNLYLFQAARTYRPPPPPPRRLTPTVYRKFFFCSNCKYQKF